MLPLQLISIFLLLPPIFSSPLVAKPGCPDRCGDLSIPYPFGVGSNCSMDSSFNIKCDTSTDPPKPYLSIINEELIEINRSTVRVKYPYLISACYDFDGTRINITAGELYKHSKSVNLSGTPYTLSFINRLTAIGCDDMVLQSNGSSVGGGCSAFCTDRNDDGGGGGVGYCPFNATSLGNGCCQADIARGNGRK